MRTRGAASCPAREFTCGEVFELAQAGSDWIWETDAELRFSWLSENYEEATGVPAEQVLGRFRFDFLKQGPQGSKQAEAHLDDLQSRRAFRDFVYEFVAGRSDCRWVSVTGFPRFSAGGAFLGYRGVGRNVTRLIVSSDRETEAEAARRQLADVLESLPAGVVIYDRDDKFVLANRKLQDSLPGLKAVWQPGLSFRDAIVHGREHGYFRSSGDPAIDILYEADADAWGEAYMARHQLGHSMYERRNPDGRWFQVVDTRTDDGTFIGVRIDITEM